MPDDLKCHLIDECDAITKQKKLPSLPMSTTVDKVLDNYVEACEAGKFSDLHKYGFLVKLMNFIWIK